MRLTGAGYELIEATTLQAKSGGTRATIVDTLRSYVAVCRVSRRFRRDLRERRRSPLEASESAARRAAVLSRLTQERRLSEQRAEALVVA